MPTIRSEFLALLKQQESALDAAWSGLAEQLAALITRYADANGNIPLDKWRQLRRELADTIHRFVLARPENAAFRVLGGGTVLPLTPYFSLLWDTLQQTIRLAVKEQNDILTAQVQDQLQGQLRRAFLDPFVRLDQLPPEEAAVLRLYQHPLEAKRDDGLMLEQRLPVAMADAQRRTTALLNTLLSDQMPATDIGQQMRLYFAGELQRAGSWGIRFGERLRRIAHSEPIFSFSLASQAAAATNPYLTTEIYIRRGRSVPCAICDGIVSNNPYTLLNVPIPGYHRDCLCYVQYRTSRQPRYDITADPQWLRTVGAMSSQFAERLMQMN